MSGSPSTRGFKPVLIFIMFCLLLFALFSVGYNEQTSVKVSSNNSTPTDVAVASKVYEPERANVEVKSEKPVLPVELPLYKLGVICNVSHDKDKRVALTFDDGPSLAMTPEYLKVLQEKGVHATFFLIGSQVERRPGLAALIADDGNEIGNHTYSHLNLKKSSITDAVKDILKGQGIIARDSHQKLFLLRPPGGELNEPVIHEIQKLGYKIVLWNIDPQDWQKDATPKQITNNIMTNLRPGSIILLHEGKTPTLEALPQLIDDIKKQGYEIGTVSELLAPSSPSRPAPQSDIVPQQAITRPEPQSDIVTPQTTPGGA